MTPITDWSCQTAQDVTTCQRTVGNQREFKISHPFKGAIFIFGFPEMGKGNLPSEKLPILGTAAIVGWPKWFPIFNRRVVYSFSYPVLECKMSVNEKAKAALRKLLSMDDATFRKTMDQYQPSDLTPIITQLLLANERMAEEMDSMKASLTCECCIKNHTTVAKALTANAGLMKRLSEGET